MNKRYQRIKRFLRFYLAVQQLRIKPYLNMILGIILMGFIEFWKNKEQFYIHAPKFILPFLRGVVQIIGISFFALLTIGAVYMIGVLTARHDEIDLEIAFKKCDLSSCYPILMQKRTDKETGVTRREFYSYIPMNRWVDNRDAIADSMNIHFVKPDIKYGGRKKANGKRIVLYTAKGRLQSERGIMYDEE